MDRKPETLNPISPKPSKKENLPGSQSFVQDVGTLSRRRARLKPSLEKEGGSGSPRPRPIILAVFRGFQFNVGSLLTARVPIP